MNPLLTSLVAPTDVLRVEGLVTHFPVHSGVLRRQVGTVRAVDGVSFSVARGSTVALVGESGSGKTTVARSILALVPSQSGRVWFRGLDLLALDPRRSADRERLRAVRRFAQMVFQDPAASLNPRHTVAQIVGRPMVLHGICPAADRDDAVRRLLPEVGLSVGTADRYPHELSGGQRQRVGIARAVGLRPELVICDEAVSALDVSVRAQVLNLLADLKRDLGLSLLFVTHDLSVVRHIADRVVVMYLGQVVEDAPRDAIFSRPFHPYTQALLAAAPPPPGASPRSPSDLRPSLGGEPPSAFVARGHPPPGGCRLRPRCPFAAQASAYGLGSRCADEEPALIEIAPGHLARCHLSRIPLSPLPLP